MDLRLVPMNAKDEQHEERDRGMKDGRHDAARGSDAADGPQAAV
jgi:hypothetical protein